MNLTCSRPMALLFWACTLPAYAAQQHVQCPPVLPAAAIQIVAPPKGWTAFTPSLVRLHAAGPIGGPPASMAILMETTSAKNATGQVDTWDLQAMSGEKWMQCSYGLGNEVTLSKRLNDDVTSCTLTYTNHMSKNDPGGPTIKIDCH